MTEILSYPSAFCYAFFRFVLGRSSNGRTADSESAYRGSNPCLPVFHSILAPLTGCVLQLNVNPGCRCAPPGANVLAALWAAFSHARGVQDLPVFQETIPATF